MHDNLMLAELFAELMLQFKFYGYFQPACPRDWVQEVAVTARNVVAKSYSVVIMSKGDGDSGPLRMPKRADHAPARFPAED